jgi:hypothetical protein
MNRGVRNVDFVTQKQATDYGVLNPLLVAMYDEFQELSKKKPQDVVSKGKVKLVNRMLTPVLELLDDEPSRVFLNLLDEDDLPENSDVVLMLGQAIAAMKSFRARYTTHGNWNITQ